MPTQFRVPVEETFSWQRPVIDKDLSTPPVSPVKGDRYIVGASATGAWVGKEKNIAWYDGAAWKFDIASQGWMTYVKDENKTYKYTTLWVIQENAGDMTKAAYDTDNDGIVDKSENVDDGAGNATSAVQVKEAYDKRGVFDTGLGAILFNL